MARKQVATRLEEDTVKALDEYVESQETPDRNNADAFRRFVREGLANRDYPVAVADGGVQNFDDRLDRIEQRQERIGLLNMAALSIGIIYITATFQYGLSNLLWAGIGVIVLVPLLLASYRYQSEGSA